VRSARQGTQYNVPWRRVCLRYLEGTTSKPKPKRPDLTLAAIYKGMGWSRSQAYQKRKFPRLTLRVAAQMATIVWPKNPATFLWDLAREEGVPTIGQRVVVKPTYYLGLQGKAKPRRPSAEVRMLMARAEANPVKPRKPRPQAGRTRGR